MEDSKEIQPRILDYKEVQKELQILGESNRIKIEEPIGYTTYGLPILQYTVGNGKNHIVITGATHGCEIITTDFILKTMQEIANENPKFKFLSKNEHTLHFIPILNPEGYLITTAAIRARIPSNMPIEEQQEFFKKYSEAYKKDDMMCHLKLDTEEKEHQKLFEEIDYTCIPTEYTEIREQIKKLYELYDIPKGTLPIWSSNANGVDINQNMEYNYKIKFIEQNINTNSILRYNNICATKPGPIGCPMRGKEFQYEPETIALRELLFRLKNDKNINLCGYLNYHSAGGELYQRPYQNTGEIDDGEVLRHTDIENIYNKKIAELYSRESNYSIISYNPNMNCLNDLLRIQIPGDILVELSKGGANPIGPCIEEYYIETMRDNLNAFAVVTEKLPEMYKIRQEYIAKKEYEANKEYIESKERKHKTNERANKNNAECKEI